MSYSRIDSRLDMLKWNMEDETRMMNEAREKMKLLADREDFEVAQFAPQYARQFAEAFEAFKRNREEFLILEKIREEQK